MTLLVILIILFLAAAFLTWSLCRIAAMADAAIEEAVREMEQPYD